jgi:hypothetical protein
MRSRQRRILYITLLVWGFGLYHVGKKELKEAWHSQVDFKNITLVECGGWTGVEKDWESGQFDEVV